MGFLALFPSFHALEFPWSMSERRIPLTTGASATRSAESLDVWPKPIL